MDWAQPDSLLEHLSESKKNPAFSYNWPLKVLESNRQRNLIKFRFDVGALSF